MLVNPEKPNEVSGASKGGATLQFAVGAVFAAGGVGTLVSAFSKGKKQPTV